MMDGLRSIKNQPKQLRMIISRFSILYILHMNMKLTKEFKVVFLQGHPYKVSMRTLIKDHHTTVTIIGRRYYNGFDDPPSLDGYCYNLGHVYTETCGQGTVG